MTLVKMTMSFVIKNAGNNKKANNNASKQAKGTPMSVFALDIDYTLLSNIYRIIKPIVNKKKENKKIFS